MKRFFKLHLDAVLIASAFLLLVVLGIYFFWGVGVLLSSLHSSLTIPSVSEKPSGFNIEGAKALNLKLEQ